MSGWRRSDTTFALGAFFAMLVVSVACEEPYFLRGLTIHHLTSVSAIPIQLLFIFRENLLDHDLQSLHWTKSILTGIPTQGGIPFFNPLYAPVALTFGFAQSIVAYDILIRIVGGLGMVLYLRKIELPRASSLITAMLFCVNPFYAAYGTDPQFGAAVFWMPWIALLLTMLFDEQRPVLLARHSIALGVLLSVAFLTTTIQSIYFVSAFLILPFVVSRIEYGDLTAWKASRHWWAQAVAVGAAYVLFLVLTSFEVVPALSNVVSQRPIESPQRYLLLGILMAMTCWALWRVLMTWRSVFSRVLLVGCVAGIWIASGIWTAAGKVNFHFLPDYFASETFGTKFRFNSHVMYFLTVGELLVAAVGLWSVRRHPKVGSMAALGVAFFVFLFGIQNYGYIDRAFFVPIFCFFVIVAGGVSSIERFLTGKKFRHAGIIMVGALLLIESMAIYRTNTLFSSALADVDRPSTGGQFLREQGASARVAWTFRDHNEFRRRFIMHPQPLVLEWLMAGYHGAHPFCFNGISVLPQSLESLSRFAYPNYFGADVSAPTNNFLHLAAVKYVVSPWALTVGDSGLRLVQEPKRELERTGYFIYENTLRFTRARLVPRLMALPPDRIHATVGGSSRSDLLDVAYTDEAVDHVASDPSPNAEIAMGDSTFSSNRGQIRLFDESDTRTRVSGHVARGSWLVLADTHFTGWTATLNGADAPIVRVNGAFIGVWLPEGKHELLFEFAPTPWKWFARLSLLAWPLALLALAVLTWRRHPGAGRS